MRSINHRMSIPDIYFQSYQKLKYWFSSYYIILLVMIVILPRNITEAELILNYTKIKKNKLIIQSIEKHFGFDKSWYSDSTRLKDVPIIAANRYLDLDFPVYSNPFHYKIEQEGEYFKNRRKILDSLSYDLFGRIHDSVSAYYLIDSILIKMKMEHFGNTYTNTSAGLAEENRRENAINIRKDMLKEINKQIDSLSSEKLSILIPQIIFTNFKLDSEIGNSNFLEFRRVANLKSKELDSLEKSTVGRIPYLDAKVDLKFLMIFICGYFLVLPFLLSLFYVNYIVREKQIKSKERVPSLKNVFLVLVTKQIKVQLLITFLTFLSIVIIPICCSLLILGIAWLIFGNGILIFALIYFSLYFFLLKHLYKLSRKKYLFGIR